MIKVENIETFGFEHSIRGMRNPMNSWEKSDSDWCITGQEGLCECCHEYLDEHDGCTTLCFNSEDKPVYVVGAADLALMRRLFTGGTEHRKFMRQIFISMDITAPLYWWKEFDTYKVGTVANSCSTMHKITSKPIEMDDFSIDDCKLEKEYGGLTLNDLFLNVVTDCESLRRSYMETKDKRYWKALIQLLPESYNQKRTVSMNYENAASMIHQREHHKLDEWIAFTDILKGLPYLMDIIGESKE